MNTRKLKRHRNSDTKNRQQRTLTPKTGDGESQKDFMISLSDDNQADVIEAFNSTSRNLDEFFNIDYHYFEGMVNSMYPPGRQLNKANGTGVPV